MIKKIYLIKGLFLLILLCCFSLCGCNKEYQISKKQSLAIFSCNDMELDDDEKKCIK